MLKSWRANQTVTGEKQEHTDWQGFIGLGKADGWRFNED